jgi:hypothetical protein
MGNEKDTNSLILFIEAALLDRIPGKSGYIEEKALERDLASHYSIEVVDVMSFFPEIKVVDEI